MTNKALNIPKNLGHPSLERYYKKFCPICYKKHYTTPGNVKHRIEICHDCVSNKVHHPKCGVFSLEYDCDCDLSSLKQPEI